MRISPHTAPAAARAPATTTTRPSRSSSMTQCRAARPSSPGPGASRTVRALPSRPSDRWMGRSGGLSQPVCPRSCRTSAIAVVGGTTVSITSYGEISGSCRLGYRGGRPPVTSHRRGAIGPSSGPRTSESSGPLTGDSSGPRTGDGARICEHGRRIPARAPRGWISGAKVWNPVDGTRTRPPPPHPCERATLPRWRCAARCFLSHASERPSGAACGT